MRKLLADLLFGGFPPGLRSVRAGLTVPDGSLIYLISPRDFEPRNRGTTDCRGELE